MLCTFMQVEFGHKTVKFEITGLASGMNKIANKVRFMKKMYSTEFLLNVKQSKVSFLISHLYIHIYFISSRVYVSVCQVYILVLVLTFFIEIPSIVNNYEKTTVWELEYLIR